MANMIRDELTYLLAKVTNRFVIVVENNADFVHKPVH